MISLRTHKPEIPTHFCHLIFQLQVVCPLILQRLKQCNGLCYKRDSVKRHKVQSLLPIICFWLPTAVNKLSTYLLLKVFKRFSNQITKYIPNCLIWADINVTTSCLKFLYCVQIEKCYVSSSLLQLSCLSFTPTHSFCLSAAPVAGIEPEPNNVWVKGDTGGGCSPHPLLVTNLFPEFLGYVL